MLSLMESLGITPNTTVQQIREASSREMKEITNAHNAHMRVMNYALNSNNSFEMRKYCMELLKQHTINPIDTDELNDKLYSNGSYYYLYVDVIGYTNGVKVDYEENKDAYYSRVISESDGFDSSGYIEIIKEDDLYRIMFSYNYARIETIVEEENINLAVLNSAYILSTIQFNTNVIELMLDDDYFTNKEEKYEVFSKNDDSGDNFELKYND